MLFWTVSLSREGNTMRTIVVIIAAFVAQGAFASCTKDVPTPGMVECTYARFTTWLSCDQRATVMSFHSLGADTGSADTRSRSYKVDDDPALVGCQQSSSNTYASVLRGYDVGHMSAINHFDDNQAAALETNHMTNLLPQASSFNQRGAWRETEKLVECYRDETGFAPLLVYQPYVSG